MTPADQFFAPNPTAGLDELAVVEDSLGCLDVVMDGASQLRASLVCADAASAEYSAEGGFSVLGIGPDTEVFIAPAGASVTYSAIVFGGLERDGVVVAFVEVGSSIQVSDEQASFLCQVDRISPTDVEVRCDE